MKCALESSENKLLNDDDSRELVSKIIDTLHAMFKDSDYSFNETERKLINSGINITSSFCSSASISNGLSINISIRIGISIGTCN